MSVNVNDYASNYFCSCSSCVADISHGQCFENPVIKRERGVLLLSIEMLCVSVRERKRNMRSWGTNVLDSWVMPCQAAVLTLVSSTPLWMFMCVFVSVHEWVILTESLEPLWTLLEIKGLAGQLCEWAETFNQTDGLIKLRWPGRRNIHLCLFPLH